MKPLKVIIDQHASADAKIGLFRSLFRGREDVYPRRFESRKTGKSGYAPACANEWVRGVCEKPRIKCAECPNRRFLSVTETVIRWHLSGHDDAGQPFVAGVYPGRMEVDLLCDDSRVVIEVDGALHLGDPEAYRRDRRKDRLLQENRYTVLRFLAEDLAKDLDMVLDAILRSLADTEARRSTMRQP